MKIQKSYIQILLLSALFHSSIFAMRSVPNIPTVPSSWMAKEFSYGVTPEGQSAATAQATVNQEVLRNAQEQFMQDQMMQQQAAQPVYSTQKMRPSYIFDEPSYEVSQVPGYQRATELADPEQKGSKKFVGGGSSGMFRQTAPRLMSRQQAATVLGVSENASPEDIKSAYRKAALKAHPDAGGSDVAMKKVNEAKDVLIHKVRASTGISGFDESEEADKKWREARKRAKEAEEAQKKKMEEEEEILKRAGEKLKYDSAIGAATVGGAIGGLYYLHKSLVGEKELYFGETDLYQAISSNNKGAVQNFIKAGSDVNKRNEFSRTPLELAILYKNKNVDIVKVLVDAGADVNAKNSYGDALLETAMRDEDTGMVKILVDAGADVNARDKWGRCPLDIAKARGYKDIVDFLLANGAKESWFSSWFR
ncbi:MAG: ankyrin repeat domain-containing protein [Candidatus Dependentiae bacterium]|nr:ankyrin repeat domain-containing protein [Candidatus Dependentiae bacterium]